METGFLFIDFLLFTFHTYPTEDLFEIVLIAHLEPPQTGHVGGRMGWGVPMSP